MKTGFCTLMDHTFWLLGLCLLPLVIGFVLMLLPASLWRGLLPRLDQTDTAMGILATGLMALGLALAVLYSQSLWGGWRSQQWQAVAGVMLEARLAETHSPRSTNPYWEPRLRYHYTVDGQPHEGRRLSFKLEKTANREALQAELARLWLPGTAVTVWVDPDDPAKSVLKPGASGWLLVFVGTGLVFLGVGAHLLRLALPGLRAHPPGKNRREKSRKTAPQTRGRPTPSARRKKGKS